MCWSRKYKFNRRLFLSLIILLSNDLSVVENHVLNADVFMCSG
jgi:hypothetical protein